MKPWSLLETVLGREGEGKRRTGRKEGGLLCSVPMGSLFHTGKGTCWVGGAALPPPALLLPLFPEARILARGKCSCQVSLSVGEGPWAPAGAGAGLAHGSNPDVCFCIPPPVLPLKNGLASGFML